MNDMEMQSHIDGMFQGLDIGSQQGESIGRMAIGEYAWHSVDSAIIAIQGGEELRGLMLLRSLMFVLAKATGRESPPFNFGTS